ncbi:restriction endonuclease [Streptomyces bungoensis]|uniref:Restriction endonuclease n=1 Tax=Streptomyces bungoensis TaxID=285568 RepID=A0A101SRT7_9ACTN|nr:restriction endonuclease [Streptomyces bungoensis]KUN79055.1 restriction endonuclease [Streptomyces bungoensis]
MTVPVHPLRREGRDRRFDLRATALFFLLLAIILCVLAFAARTAAGIVERRPLWAGALLISGVAVAVLCRSRRRRFSAAAYARRAARALEEAAETASTSLSVAAAGAPVAAPAGTAAAADPLPSAAPPAPGHGEEYPPPESTQAITVPLRPGAEERTECVTEVIDYAELDPDGFEQAIADLCVRDACRDVVVEGGPGDLGADVRAVTPDGRRVIIQCKQYCETNKVGSQDMQRFGGTCFTVHEADVAAVVTTSDFTEPALEYARQCGIVCVDGQDLQAWTDGTGPSPWERAGVAP